MFFENMGSTDPSTLEDWLASACLLDKEDLLER